MFVVCGVLGSVGDDCLRERGLPVYGSFYVCMGSVYGDVKIVQIVIFLRSCCEL